MNYFHTVAFFESGAFVLGSGHDLFIALDRNQSLSKPERSEQLLHGRAWFDQSLFAVDHESHLLGA